jgi:arginase
MGMQDAVHSAMLALLHVAQEAHLHVDLDVLNPREAPANGFVTEETGLRVDELTEAIDRIKENVKITSATIASYDPQYDPEGKTLQAGLRFMKQITD